MKTTVEIPEKLFRQAKAYAAREGLTLREFFIRGIKLALQAGSENVDRKRVAFPIIRGTRDALLTDEEVTTALNTDEGLL